jgi:hypothetical protein
MKDLTTISTDLFNKVRSRFGKIKLGDAKGNVITDPSVARFFDLTYEVNNESIGQVNIKIDENSLTVIYSESMTEGMHKALKNNWYSFLKELRLFAKSNMLNFDTRDITKSNLDVRDYQYLAQENGDTAMSESKLHGTSKTSYQPVGEANIIIKHSKPVNYELPAGRTLNIESIYIESANGERFKYPYKHLAGARAMARHVANGGNTYDSIGQHISGLSEELSKLRQFKNYTQRNNIVSETLDEVKDRVLDRITSVKKEIESLQKQGYYETFKESFKPAQDIPVPEETVNSWVDALTIRTFNEELKTVFPYIYKLVDHAEVLGPEDMLGESDDCDETCPKSCPDCGGTGDPEKFKKMQKESSQFDQFADAVDSIASLQYEKELDEEFDPEYFDGEFEMDVAGDDGEDETITVYYTAHHDDGEIVIHPQSLRAYSNETNPSARVDDDWATRMVAPGGNEHDEALDAAQDDAENQWSGGSDDIPFDGPYSDKKIAKAGKHGYGPSAAKHLAKQGMQSVDEDVVEFIRSMYDSETGTFPRGEEGVVIAAEKQFGEMAGKYASFVVEKLSTRK